MREIIIENENKKETSAFCYERRAHYYETDQMGIVHHSNYIRWMEEARIAYMDAIGIPYRVVEEKGIMIPVLSASCEYKNFVRFDEIVEIYPTVSSFNGIRMTLDYRIIHKETKKLCTIGHTGHCFTNTKMQPVSLKKQDKDMYQILASCLSLAQ